MRRDKIIWVLNQLVLREPIDPSHDARGADESESKAADALDNRMGALQQYAHFEDTVNPLLVHPAVIAASVYTPEIDAALTAWINAGAGRPLRRAMRS
jgi:hypothetical protein